MNDESEIPAHGGYSSELTLAWSQKISAAAAFIFVTPQYNWGYPAALKNALDHLYREWRNKPGMIVSYGGHGGGKCAEQLAQVLRALKMRVVPTMPALVIPEGVIRGAPLEPDKDFSLCVQLVQTAMAELVGMLDNTVEPTASAPGTTPRGTEPIAPSVP